MKTLIVLGTSLLSISVFSQVEFTFSEVVKLPNNINSDAEELMPLFSPEGEMYFVRARHEENVGGSQTGHDIWKSKIGSSQLEFSDPKNEFKKLNNKANNAVVGITADNKKLYVLNSYHREVERHRGIATVANDGSWKKPAYSEIQDMEYTSSLYGFYVTPDESVMVISMKGDNTNGMEDLYISEMKNGIWTKPVSLGSKINTTGFEISPSISPDGQRLYFSSNGHGGSGDADMFYCVRTGDSWTDWSAPINMGPEVNSPKFDAYFVEGPNSYGYFSSNRDEFHSDLYCVQIKKEEILVEEPELIVEEIDEVEEVEEEVMPEVVVMVPSLSDINFNNDSYTIEASEKSELDKAAAFLNQNEDYNIIITGHADATWTTAYNKTLSKKRADAAKKYLTSKGISASRIIVKYVGESKLKVETEETNRSNRRVTLEIVE